MALVKILDLVGKPVDGMVVDIRSRRANGSLHYDSTIDEPRTVTLKSVEIRKERLGSKGPKVPWLYWTWHAGSASPPFSHNCNYSGTASDFDIYYLEVVKEV